MTKVLMLSWEVYPYSCGGLGRHVYWLLRSLWEQGTSAVAFCGASAKVLSESRFRPDFKDIADRVRYTYEAPALSLFRDIDGINFDAISRSLELLNDEKDWVIHIHDWHLSKAGILLSSVLNIPIVATFHSTTWGRPCPDPLIKARISEREKELALRAQKVITVSASLAGEIAASYGLRTSEISVIPNGAPNAALNGAATQCGEPCQTPVVIYVGRLSREKGVDTLLKAFSLLQAEGTDFRGIIVGEGPEEPALKASADRLHLDSSVEFLGFLPDSERDALLRKGSVAVVPSLYEPFGIVALEAMAAGVPVVASEVGGLAEIVRNYETGLTVRPGDAISLAHAIKRLLTDRALAGCIRDKAKAAAEEYDWGDIARKTVEVYRCAVFDCCQ